MDEKKIREAIEELRIGIETCEGMISYNGNFEPKNTCERLTEKIRNFNTAIEALEKQLPKKVKIEAWSPSYCPSCGYELSEDLGDGYYRHPDSVERCPNPDCGQRLDWSE